MSKSIRILTGSIFSIIVVLSLVAASCGAKSPAYVTPPLGKTTTAAAATTQVIAPYLPPSYYQCTEVLPMEIEKAYYSEYGNAANAASLYNGVTYVFKDQLVDAYMIREVDKGWLWADLTKCPIINIDLAKQLKPGDRVDIVGICTGRDLTQSPGLVFRDCYVLYAASLQLPAPGGATFIPNY